MGLGSTAKKIQTVADRAEQLYAQIQDLQERIVGLEQSVDDTSDSVQTLEHAITEQRAILTALADEQGLDVEEVLADAAIEEVEASDAGDDDASAETTEPTR